MYSLEPLDLRTYIKQAHHAAGLGETTHVCILLDPDAESDEDNVYIAIVPASTMKLWQCDGHSYYLVYTAYADENWEPPS